MPTIEVFDPPMCCSTGVCGPEPDERLARFAADLDWLKRQGAEVRRYNLAQEPTAFTASPQVTQIVNATGGDGLPIIVVDGKVVSQGIYPSREQLAAYAGISAAAGADGAPSVAERAPVFDDRIAELVAIGAAVAANCEPCLRYHYRKATELGIARDDMIQAVNVALQVKEQPARMMIRAAQRLLVPEAAQGACCGGDGKDGGCC